MPRLSLLIITVLLLGPFVAVAQSPVPTPSEEVPSGSIRGRVVSETGQPINGATVSVRPAGPTFAARTSIAGAEGEFEVKNLDPGLYYINANAPAYVTAPPDYDLPTPLYRIGDSVRLELVRGGVITGTITNSANEPVVGARVRAIMVRDGKGKSMKSVYTYWGDRTSDDRGIYRLYGLAPGTYIVQVGGTGSLMINNPADLSAPTFAPSSPRDTALEIEIRSGDESIADIRFRGEQGRTISGTVVMLGSNMATISMRRKDEPGIQAMTAVQRAGSRGFMIAGVADGEYELTAQELTTSGASDVAYSDPLRITVKGTDVSGLQLVTKLPASIRGRLILEESKLQECQNKRKPLFAESAVMLTPNRKQIPSIELVLMRNVTQPNVVDRDGEFRLRNLRPGQYAFNTKFYARYWYLKSISFGSTSAATASKNAGSSTDAARNWTVVKSGQQITGLTITLSAGAASIRGALEKKDDAPVPNGLFVYLVAAERDKADDPLRYFLAKVEDDGKFAFNNLPPGKYLSLVQQPAPNTPNTTEQLQLPDATETRTKLRRLAESVKSEVDLKPCQNLTGYSLKP